MTIKRKHIIRILLLAVLIFAAIPTIKILSTYLKENKVSDAIPKGYTNDAGGLELTKVDTIIDVAKSKEAIVAQLKTIILISKAKQIPISIAGAKHSMGGHTMYKDGIVLNMRPYNHMQLDTVNDILTVGSGALWNEIINYLNKFDKSVAVMQAFSSFSIGGSISVNGHGWQHNSPPVSSSVVSFTLLNADGEVVNCSRTENQELFKLVIGGYGLFGVILDVKLKVVDNENLNFRRYEFGAEDYLAYFEKYVNKNKHVKLVFGRLNVSNKQFLENATLNIFMESKKPLVKNAPITNTGSSELKRVIFRSTVNSEYGKRLRWDLETYAGEFSSSKDFTRNDILNDDVKLIENKDTTSTDILQEYFIPKRHFNEYIAGLKKILPNQTIDLLNVTIRNVYKDNDSYMRYANEDVFGFVFLFNQKKNAVHEKEMKKMTNRMVDLAIKMEGTYYLPYRLHIDRDKMRKAYPQSDSFFKLKLKYDKDRVFMNKFYEQYQ